MENSNSYDVIKSIKDTRKLSDGIYIRGTVQVYPLLFTADTGASKTIISNRVFESLKPEDRPELAKNAKLVGASGESIKEWGKGTCSIKLGSIQMEIEAIVTVVDDGLLGVDILQNGGNGPADLLMSKGVMVFNNKEVPTIQVGITNRVRKVTAADDFVVPAQSDCLIDVNLERKEYDVSRERDYIAEPTEHFQAEYPLLMASTLVDIKEASTCKVGMLNPFPTAIPIKQDAVIGKEQPMASKPRVIGNQRDNSEVETHTTLGRIKPFKEETSQSFSANVTRKAQVDGDTDVPGQ